MLRTRIFVINRSGYLYEVVYDNQFMSLRLKEPTLGDKSDILHRLVTNDNNYKTRAIVINANGKEHGDNDGSD